MQEENIFQTKTFTEFSFYPVKLSLEKTKTWYTDLFLKGLLKNIHEAEIKQPQVEVLRINDKHYGICKYVNKLNKK